MVLVAVRLASTLVAVKLTMLSAPVEGSLTLATLRVNTSDTGALEVSVAVTRTSMLPMLALAGVPLKVRVPALKLNQVGSAEPSAKVAV